MSARAPGRSPANYRLLEVSSFRFRRLPFDVYVGAGAARSIHRSIVAASLQAPARAALYPGDAAVDASLRGHGDVVSFRFNV